MLPIFFGSLLCFLDLLRPALDLFFPIHRAAATLGSAPAQRFVVIVAVIEVIVVGQLFAGGDVTQRQDPDVLVEFVGLAIGIAAMINESRHAVAVHYVLALTDAEQVRIRPVGVQVIGLFFREPRFGVLD